MRRNIQWVIAKRALDERFKWHDDVLLVVDRQLFGGIHIELRANVRASIVQNVVQVMDNVLSADMMRRRT